ncbi:hypothetical protein BX616_010111 [Lobosporangium transversale]|uniref:Uncharacterized protein n=1 Tax=Lobosporangium transversale TaxID=64571 RepID=A0A1Y2G9B2_9FUNG|nr:hypothetical protein BCR41DRAFT_374810 [Lobosporangium transversale]KAF9913383.1 hypothetical protein BX616_010111 [Lobosporangium transversale]ORZ04703.1 hypothetical protein BCR41DRAFT_374810 [Lobosporangium transversale]|eukprot:XP_021876700.1 hypothetical protein BCR41DRAFT_374810 [Lobosporangium transversale]
MATLHTTPLWTYPIPSSDSRPASPLPFLEQSLLSVAPHVISSGCKIKNVRPGLFARSTSTSSVPQLTDVKAQVRQPTRSKEAPSSLWSSSTAINIPSPPLTPHMRANDEDDNDVDEDNLIFSSRFQHQSRHEKQQDDDPSSSSLSMLMRQSSSAPSAMSPIELQPSLAVSTGFTFSSNLLSPTKTKEDRESYDVFVTAMEEDYWKSVSTIRTTYFFDGIGRGGGFLAIPHIASHGNAKTNVICRLLEAWLTKKLVEPTISDSIPVLEDNIESSVESIERHLRQDPKVWSGISKSFIHIRCGHVFMLDTCCDDETIVHLGADEFYQDYPLFVDVEIKMHCDSNHLPKDHSTELLIAFQNVVNRTKNKDEEKPFVHRTIIGETRQY